MKEEKEIKQCPEAESFLAKCFLVARGFSKRISCEKKENKEIINLKNRFCEIEIKNIFPYESEMDMPLIGSVKYIEPQHMYFTEKYKDKDIKSFGVISNEPLNPNQAYYHQENYFDFRHVIKYKDKLVIISYERPQHRNYRCSQSCLQLSYYENNDYTKEHRSESRLLADAFSESCSYYPWEKYMKKYHSVSYCHYYDECAFAEIYREVEDLLGVKIGYRIDLALKYLRDKRKIINRISASVEHSRRIVQYTKRNKK